MCKSGRTIHSMRFVLEGWNGKQAHEWSDYSLNFDFDFKCEVCESNKSTNRNHGNHVFMFGTSKIWSVFYATIFFGTFSIRTLHLVFSISSSDSFKNLSFCRFLDADNSPGSGPFPHPYLHQVQFFSKKRNSMCFFVKFNNWYIDIYCNMQLIYCHNCFEASCFLVLFLYTFCIYRHIRIYIYIFYCIKLCIFVHI